LKFNKKVVGHFFVEFEVETEDPKEKENVELSNELNVKDKEIDNLKKEIEEKEIMLSELSKNNSYLNMVIDNIKK